MLVLMLMISNLVIEFLHITMSHVILVIFVNMEMKQCAKNIMKQIFLHVVYPKSILVPEWNVSHGGVLKLSDSMTFEEAAMIEPLACCVRSWSKYNYLEGDSVAVFGVGPTGMMHVMLAHSKKFSKIFCFDVNDFRLNFAKKFNVTETINSTDENRVEKIP